MKPENSAGCSFCSFCFQQLKGIRFFLGFFRGVAAAIVVSVPAAWPPASLASFYFFLFAALSPPHVALSRLRASFSARRAALGALRPLMSALLAPWWYIWAEKWLCQAAGWFAAAWWGGGVPERAFTRGKVYRLVRFVYRGWCAWVSIIMRHAAEKGGFIKHLAADSTAENQTEQKHTK